jgi:hypothetical protein
MQANSDWSRLKAEPSGVGVLAKVVKNRELLVASHSPRPPPAVVISPAIQIGPASYALRSLPPGLPLYAAQGVGPLRVETTLEYPRPKKEEKKQNGPSKLELFRDKFVRTWESYD